MATTKSRIDPNAAVRNRAGAIFDASSPKVKDNADHFPIPDEAHARNALARAAQFSSVPPWYDGTLEELQAAVRRAVSKKFPGIDVAKPVSKMLVDEDRSWERREIKGDGIKITRLSIVDRAASGLQLLYKSFEKMQQLVKGTERGEILTLAVLPGRPDSDGEVWGPEAVVKAAHSWAQNGMQLDIQHASLFDGRPLMADEAYAAESWIVAKGDPRFEGWKDSAGNAVDATGGWAVLIKVEDPALRERVRSGELDGSSPFGWAVREVVKSTPSEDIDMDAKELAELLEKSNERLMSGFEKIVKSLAPQPAVPAPAPAPAPKNETPAPVVVKFEGDPTKAEDLAAHKEKLMLAECDLNTGAGLAKWEKYLSDKAAAAKPAAPVAKGASLQTPAAAAAGQDELAKVTEKCNLIKAYRAGTIKRAPAVRN